MLNFSHDYRMVIASLAVALMAGFTGLSLTRGASKLPVGQRKLVVSMAAVALGGGIWSMHFVAMLGLQLPILFYYDALVTLILALLAILITGVALLLLTFSFGFTGYLLPWDQLSIWAVTVGSNMARATPLLGYEGPGQQLLTIGGIDMITDGSDARFGLLGARFVGEETLNRFYVLHCTAIPLAVALLLAIHFWRVRKDGGISGPL